MVVGESAGTALPFDPFDPIDEAARQWALRWDGVTQ